MKTPVRLAFLLFFFCFVTLFNFSISKTFAQDETDYSIEKDQQELNEIIRSMMCYILDQCDEQSPPPDGGEQPLPTWPDPSDQPNPDPETSRTPNPSVTPPLPPPPPPNPPPDDENHTTATCPIINGKIICGSYDTAPPDSSLSCQHCRPGYPEPSACQYPGTAWAVDVKADPNSNIFFPHINNKVVEWTHLPQYEVRYSTNAIQKYIGTLLPNRDKRYWLQLHHTKIGSGKSGQSGNKAANVCPSCFSNPRNAHVHIQIGSDTIINSKRSWYDAAKIINCR